MDKRTVIATLFLGVLLSLLAACRGSNSSDQSNDATEKSDSVQAPSEEELPELKGDEMMNRAAQFYAGISKEGVNLNDADAKAWDQYRKGVEQRMKKLSNITYNLDSIATADFSDFRGDVDYVFYPFSGADFIYPLTIFPDADTYYLFGLEKTGSPIGQDVKTSFSLYEAYRVALSTYFSYGYFITKDMSKDLHNEEIDGVCPVITMLMATIGYDVISVNYKQLNAQGDFVDADAKSNILEFKFFKKGSKHEQTLYYVSGDAQNAKLDPNIRAYLNKTLPNHKVGTLLKAASFLLRWDSFSDVRDYILDNSIAVVQDDSGIPYRYFNGRFDVTLYGKYQNPNPSEFAGCEQPDLEAEYKKNADSIHPLNFIMGYKYSRNLMCARKKATQTK